MSWQMGNPKWCKSDHTMAIHSEASSRNMKCTRSIHKVGSPWACNEAKGMVLYVEDNLEKQRWSKRRSCHIERQGQVWHSAKCRWWWCMTPSNLTDYSRFKSCQDQLRRSRSLWLLFFLFQPFVAHFVIELPKTINSWLLLICR